MQQLWLTSLILLVPTSVQMVWKSRILEALTSLGDVDRIHPATDMIILSALVPISPEESDVTRLTDE